MTPADGFDKLRIETGGPSGLAGGVTAVARIRAWVSGANRPISGDGFILPGDSVSA